MKVTIDISDTVPLSKPQLRKHTVDSIINIFGTQYSNMLFKYSKYPYKKNPIIGNTWYFNSEEPYDVEMEKKITLPLVKSVKALLCNRELSGFQKMFNVDIDPHGKKPMIYQDGRGSKPRVPVIITSINHESDLVDTKVIKFRHSRSFKELSKEKIVFNFNNVNIEDNIFNPTSIEDYLNFYVYLELTYDSGDTSGLLFNKALYINQIPVPDVY